MDNIENSPVVDSDQNLLIFKTTSEGTNFKVHFTIRAQKVHGQMGVYTGGAGSSTCPGANYGAGGGGAGRGTNTPAPMSPGGNANDGIVIIAIKNP